MVSTSSRSGDSVCGADATKQHTGERGQNAAPKQPEKQQQQQHVTLGSDDQELIHAVLLT